MYKDSFIELFSFRRGLYNISLVCWLVSLHVPLFLGIYCLTEYLYQAII